MFGFYFVTVSYFWCTSVSMSCHFFFSLNSNTNRVFEFLSVSSYLWFSCALNQRTAYCFVDSLLSVHILKHGPPNWALCSDADDLVVQGGLFFIYLFIVTSSSQESLALPSSFCMLFVEGFAGHARAWESASACAWVSGVPLGFCHPKALLPPLAQRQGWNPRGSRLSLVRQMGTGQLPLCGQHRLQHKQHQSLAGMAPERSPGSPLLLVRG